MVQLTELMKQSPCTCVRPSHPAHPNTQAKWYNIPFRHFLNWYVVITPTSHGPFLKQWATDQPPTQPG
jgi:hypothetical protein